MRPVTAGRGPRGEGRDGGEGAHGSQSREVISVIRGWGVKRVEVPPPRASQLNDPLERHKNKAPVPDEGGKGGKN